MDLIMPCDFIKPFPDPGSDSETRKKENEDF